MLATYSVVDSCNRLDLKVSLSPYHRISFSPYLLISLSDIDSCNHLDLEIRMIPNPNPNWTSRFE